MDQPYWADRWRTGQIGFHLTEVNPHLIAHAAALGPAPTRVLVPLCGKSRDLLWLRDRGHPVLGVEFVEAAARDFFADNHLQPVDTRLGLHRAIVAGAITIVIDDFLALDPAAVGASEAVWDRAALIALAPEVRLAYLRRLRSLVTDRANILMITFDHDLPGGPPFSVSDADLGVVTQGLFSLEMLDDQDILSSEPRFQARGATRMREKVFLLRPVTSQI